MAKLIGEAIRNIPWQDKPKGFAGVFRVDDRTRNHNIVTGFSKDNILADFLFYAFD